MGEFGVRAAKNPLNTVSIVELTVDTERHFVQVLEMLPFATGDQFVEGCF